MSLDIDAILSMNILMGDIYNLMHILSKLNIDTSQVTMDDMEVVAQDQYRRNVNGYVLHQKS